MENSYGIGVQNRFGAYFDEEADPFDLIAKPAAVPRSSDEKENKDKKSSKTTTKKANKSDVVAKPEKTVPQGKTQDAKQQRNGDNRVKFSDREERNNRRNRPENAGPRDTTNGHVGQRFDEDRPPRRFDNDRPPRRFDNDRPPRRFDDDGAPRQRFTEGAPRRFNDGEGGGRGRGRGMGRGRGRGGKREFDRHSGSERSGVKPVDKREGSGSYNWGSDKDQIQEIQTSDQLQATELDTSNEEKEKAPKEAGEEGGATSEGESGKEDAPKEDEEPKEMTLDEYKAMQKAARVKPEFKLRKAGEGENTNQWKKTYVLKKKEESDDEEESSGEEEVGEEDDHHNKKKYILDIDFQFNDSPGRGGRGRGRGRGGMGRGGRGGERGSRGAGRGGYGGRGGRNMKQEAPKMDDECDFPTLKLGK